MSTPVWHSHGFTIFANRVYDSEPVVHVETLTSGINVRNPADVARFQDAFARLQQAALVGDAAHALLQQLAEELSGGTRSE